MNQVKLILYNPKLAGWDNYDSSFWANDLVELHELYTSTILPDNLSYVTARHVFESGWSPSPNVTVGSIMICGGEVGAFLDFVHTIEGQFDFIFVVGEQVGGPIASKIADFFTVRRGELTTFRNNGRPALRVIRGGKDDKYGPN